MIEKCQLGIVYTGKDGNRSKNEHRANKNLITEYNIMKNNNDDAIVNPTSKEIVEHPEYALEAIERLNLPHPDYDG